MEKGWREFLDLKMNVKIDDFWKSFSSKWLWFECGDIEPTRTKRWKFVNEN